MALPFAARRALFHAERAARELVRKHLGSLPEVRQKEMNRLRRIFGSRKRSTFCRRWGEFFQSRGRWPKAAEPIFEMLQRYKPHLRYLIEHPEVSATSNAAERAIKGFDLKSRTTGGYSKLHSVREFLTAWVVIQRLITGVSWRAGPDPPAGLTRGDCLLAC